jgi:hypothetical protein
MRWQQPNESTIYLVGLHPHRHLAAQLFELRMIVWRNSFFRKDATLDDERQVVDHPASAAAVRLTAAVRLSLSVKETWR